MRATCSSRPEFQRDVPSILTSDRTKIQFPEKKLIYPALVPKAPLIVTDSVIHFNHQRRHFPFRLVPPSRMQPVV